MTDIVLVLLMPQPEGPVVQGGIELLDSPGKKWVDVFGPNEETMGVLAKKFGLHRLAVEDCLHLDQRPKIEEYPGHLFIVFQSFVSHKEDPCALDMREMHMFIGPDWLITVHDTSSGSVEAVRQRVMNDPAQTLWRGSDFVGYLVADHAVDANFPVLDLFSDELEDLESRIFVSQNTGILQRVFELKRALTAVRRILSPQRDVMGVLSRHGLPHIGERTVFYFRDVYDHLIRLYEQIEASRDLVGNTMEAYLSMMANRTNEITKRLTLFASIFLPLSFVVGFFGQNFELLSRPFFFYLMLSLMVGLPVGLSIWFRRVRWM